MHGKPLRLSKTNLLTARLRANLLSRHVFFCFLLFGALERCRIVLWSELRRVKWSFYQPMLKKIATSQSSEIICELKK